MGKEPKPKGKNGNGKSAKLTTTEKWRLEQEPALATKQARRQAMRPPGQESPQYETIVKIGRVERYDSRTMSDFVSILGPSGPIELPFLMSSIMSAGITSLHSGHELECIDKPIRKAVEHTGEEHGLAAVALRTPLGLLSLVALLTSPKRFLVKRSNELLGNS